MRGFVGHLWCALLPCAVALGQTTYLSASDLLQSWNDTMAARIQDWEYQETFPDFLYACTDGFQQSMPECVIGGSYVYFLNTTQNIDLGPFSQMSLVPVDMMISRPTNATLPAVAFVDFSRKFYHNGYLVVPGSNVWFRPSYSYPVPWDTLSQSIAFAQDGHMPISLLLLTYPGFSDWAIDNYDSSVSTTITGAGSQTLRVTTYFKRWDSILRDWAPGVYRAVGYVGSTNYYMTPPRVHASWTPRRLSWGIHPVPCYPGPYWHQNINRLNSDGTWDYMLSPRAIVDIAAEFADYGMEEDNPFGDLRSQSFENFGVFPVDEDRQPRVNTRVRILATVSEKEGD